VIELDHVANLVALFREACLVRPDMPFLWAKRDGAWVPTSWRETRQAVDAIARFLAANGIQPGDRVAIISENRPEWAIADVAILAAGAISVPAYTTNTSNDHFHILADSGAKAAIVSSASLADKLLPAAVRAELAFVITMERLNQTPQGLDIFCWADALATGAEGPSPVEASATALASDDTACLIYTSGTGGAPRGVMLTHENLLSICRATKKVLASLGLEHEIFMSFLPLSHAYEHTAGLYFPIAIAADIYYAESADKLMANMAETHPTLTMAVPRLYEVLHQRILATLKRVPKFRRRLFDLTLALGSKRYRDPASLTLGERLLDRLLDKMVRDKMRARFGGKLKAFVSGGAALNPDIALFFTALGLRVLQGYGQTEAGPVVSVNPCVKIKLDTVGPPLDGCTVRIAEDGEILVRGPMVMKGYWRDPEATAATVRDGWLHTGDIGLIDTDGYIKITDRKRDIIVLSGGDNISPARIEGLLTLEPAIAQAMVYGDRKPYLVALIVPDESFIAEFCNGSGAAPDLAALSHDRTFRAGIGAAIDRVNKRQSPLERVRSFIIAPAPFSTENGQMTPTLKVRRHIIRGVYGAELEGLYGEKS
jgi:long-chain acyl-CoA synthetase